MEHKTISKEEELAQLEFEVGCWYHDYMNEPTDEVLRGLLDAERKLKNFREENKES